jgi:hypothetical protein
MIRDRLVPALVKKYGEQGFQPGSSPDSIAAFPPIHPQGPDLRIMDDGDEATIYLGDITHGHFNPYDPDLAQDEIDARVTDDVLLFLDELFADKYLLWKSTKDGSGGWEFLDNDLKLREPDANTKYFLWSGPVELCSGDSRDKLAQLADEALAEFRAGKTASLDELL